MLKSLSSVGGRSLSSVNARLEKLRQLLSPEPVFMVKVRARFETGEFPVLAGEVSVTAGGTGGLEFRIVIVEGKL
jgi:hypothetical protein